MIMKYIPRSKKILRSVWVHRIKLHSDGAIKKYKSRLNADGSIQEQGVDYHL